MRGTARYLGVLGLVLAAGCGRQGWGNHRSQTEFLQTTDAAGVTHAIIETQNGSVDVDCRASGEQMSVAGTKYADAPSVETARQRVAEISIVVERETGRPEVLHIRAEVPRFTDGSAGASFRLRLPSEVAVTIRTSNGPATVIAARGNVDVETSNGHIRAESLGAGLLARTSNGGITAKHVAGDVDAVSSNGGIDLQQIGQEHVIARTSNGRIHVTDALGTITLVSNNGPVDLRAGSLPKQPHIQVQTANASARVELPRDVAAALRLQTSNGRARADLSGAQVAERRDSESSISATLNGGGGQIDIVTSNGPVQFSLIDRQPITAETPATIPAAH